MGKYGGGCCENNRARGTLANSRGFGGEYRTRSCSLRAIPVAKEGESMERDYWFSLARSFEGLEKPADIGRIAAQRAVRRLGAVKVETQKVPVVFEPRTARTLLANIFEAVHGSNKTAMPEARTADPRRQQPL